MYFYRLPYRARNRHELKSHIDALHKPNRDKKLSCPLCTKTFYTRSDVNFHVRGAHLNEKEYKCDNCSYATSYASDLKRHRGRRFTCAPRGFRARSQRGGYPPIMKKAHLQDGEIQQQRLDDFSKMEGERCAGGNFHLFCSAESRFTLRSEPFLNTLHGCSHDS